MNKRWELVDSQKVFESKWLNVENRTYKLPNGEIGENYIHVSRPDYVLILAIDEQDRVIVEKQYRRGVDDFVYELPAGWIEDGETPIQAAKRELREETGYVAEGIEKQVVYPEPAFMALRAYVVILRFNQKNKTERELADDETIELEYIKIEDVKTMIAQGKIEDMGFLAAWSIYQNSL